MTYTLTPNYAVGLVAKTWNGTYYESDVTQSGATIQIVDGLHGGPIGASLWAVIPGDGKPVFYSTTLASNYTGGASTISVNAPSSAFPSGALLAPAQATVFKIGNESVMVRSVTGTGPYTLTLVAPLVNSYTSGAPITYIAPTASGTCSKALQTITIATAGVWTGASGAVGATVNSWQFYCDATSPGVADTVGDVWYRGNGASSSSYDVELWWKRASVAGAQTVFVAFDPNAVQDWQMQVDDFQSSAGTSTTWSQAAATAQENTSSTTVAFPSLTAVSGDVYVGAGSTAQTVTAGTTSGFTYDTPSGNAVFCYNPNTGSGAIAPTATCSPTGVSGTAGLVVTPSAGTVTHVNRWTGQNIGPGESGYSIAISPAAVGDLIVLSHCCTAGANNGSIVGPAAAAPQGCIFSIFPATNMFKPVGAGGQGYTQSTANPQSINAMLGTAHNRAQYSDANGAGTGASSGTASSIHSLYVSDPTYNGAWLDPGTGRTPIPWINSSYQGGGPVSWNTTVANMVAAGNTGWVYELPSNEPENGGQSAATTEAYCTTGYRQIRAMPLTGVTTANPGVVTTSVAHGYISGQSITISGVVGATQANGTWTITVLSGTTFSIPVNVTGTYSSGGTASADPTARVGVFCSGGVPEDSSYATLASVLAGVAHFDEVMLHDENPYGNQMDLVTLRLKWATINNVVKASSNPTARVWATETGMSGGYFGVYNPRRHAAQATKFLMVREAFGYAKEFVFFFENDVTNQSSTGVVTGFYEIPGGGQGDSWGLGSSPRLAAHCIKILSEALWGTTCTPSSPPTIIPFGPSQSWADQAYFATHYSSSALGRDVVPLATNGIGWTQSETITLKVTGGASSLSAWWASQKAAGKPVMWNGLGQDITSQCTLGANGDQITVPVDDLLGYAFLPLGCTVSVVDTGSHMLTVHNQLNDLIAAAPSLVNGSGLSVGTLNWSNTGAYSQGQQGAGNPYQDLLTITALTVAGTTWTATVSTTAGLASGTTVSVVGTSGFSVSPNGQQTITVTSGTQFTFTATTASGSYSGGGTVSPMPSTITASGWASNPTLGAYCIKSVTPYNGAPQGWTPTSWVLKATIGGVSTPLVTYSNPSAFSLAVPTSLCNDTCGLTSFWDGSFMWAGVLATGGTASVVTLDITSATFAAAPDLLSALIQDQAFGYTFPTTGSVSRFTVHPAPPTPVLAGKFYL